MLKRAKAFNEHMFYLDKFNEYDKDECMVTIDKGELNKHFVINFKIIKANFYQKYYGYAITNTLIMIVKERLTSLFKKYKVVDNSYTQITIAVPYENEEKVEEHDYRFGTLQTICEHIKEQFSEPFSIEGYLDGVTIPYHFGACCNGERNELIDMYDMIKFAEIAMNIAKDQNQHYTIADDALIFEEKDVMELSEVIFKGIEDGEFVPFYQPIVSSKTTKIVGCESLARWRKDKYRVIVPNKFVDYANQKDILSLIDEQIIRKAINDFKNWNDEGLINKKFVMVFNLSLRSLFTIDFEKIKKRILDIGAKPSNFQFDIDGEVLSEVQTYSKLDYLKQLGFSLAIDNLGSVNASIYSLLNVDFDTIKVSKNVLPQENVTEKHVIINKIVKDLAENLDSNTVIQGVVNKKQLLFAEEFEYDAIQGYYFSLPQSVDEFTVFLNKYKDGIIV